MGTIKEVEEVACQKVIDRVKHEKVTTSWDKCQEQRNRCIARDILGRANHTLRWVEMSSNDLKALETRVAEYWRKADRVAIANGLPLNIDKQLDTMLMG
ncbi:predicted protein kinase (pseudogene) [Salmonella phage Vi06]|uniref:Uncharacterized protein n=1 Tax=Salmonella phage Vi06 TaxID=866889 RepID=E1XU82_9CAUD|nr:serine-threonine kinase [Salmonella phage Vi06]CBV65201.1 predicted protein kinase (pseudogene) [Salmonella phage Vi06]